jgi:hypothetical protein
MRLNRWITFGGLLLAAAGTAGTWYGNFWGTGNLQLAQTDQGVTGATVYNTGGGTGANMSVTGAAGQPPRVGWDIDASGAPGRSVTGLQIIQNGPGTGMNITVGGDGPATGVRVNVTGR